MRPYQLWTYRGRKRIDRDGVGILVILDLNVRDDGQLEVAKDQLNRHLISEARKDGAKEVDYRDYEFAVYATDEAGAAVGRELFRWTLPVPPEVPR